MRCDWPTRTVAELEREGILLVQDGNHGEYRPRRDEIRSDGTPHIRAADISDSGVIDFERAQKINDVALARIRKGVGARGDVLLTHKGTVGRIARVPPTAPDFVCSPQTTFWRSLNPQRIDQAYLFAYLRSPHFAAQLRTRMHESDMAPYVSLTAQRSFSVAVPSIEEQQLIASVLEAIDDKIDSNERLCNLLAAATSILVRHRVVDAEPGNSWTRGDLASIARFVNGRAFTKHANGTGRPILRIKELNSGLSQATPYSDIDAEDDNIARHNDVLFSWSGSLEIYRWHGPESLINQHIFKVLPLEPYPAWFVVEWVREHMPEFQRIAREKATTMGHIKREHLAQAVVNIPPAALIGELDAEVAPLVAQIGALAAETATLRAIRDGLLPKLISGEIRVSKTDDHVPSISVAAEEVPA